MANDLAVLVPKIIAQGLLALREMAVMPRLVNTDYGNDAREKGDTIDVPIPSAIAAAAVTAAATPPSTADMVPTKAQIPLDKWYEAAFYLSDKDMKEVLNGIIPMQVSEAVRSLANQVNSDLFALYKKVYGYVGTAGTTPFATDVSAATAARRQLLRQLAPLNPRRMVLDPDAEANALGLRAFQDASFRADAQGIIEGQIGRKLGFDFFTDQAVPTHTLGAAGTALLDDTVARAVGLKTLHMDGFTTKPSVGDLFTIAGDTQVYTVVSASTLAGTDSDIVFEPGLKVAIPAADGNEAVTFKATHVANLAFHRDAFALATRPLEDGMAGQLGSIVTSQVDPVSRLSLRLEVTREHKRIRWSFDILYGVACVRPELAVRVAG